MNEYDDTTTGTTTHTTTGPMIGPLDAPETTTGLHPVNITQLVMGVAFAGMLLVWALYVGDVATGDDFRWLLPIPWLAAGGAGLAATLVHSRRSG